MAESILARVQRVVSAGLESAVGAAERVSGESLMREAIREVDAAIDKLRRQQQAAKVRHAHATQQLKSSQERMATLEEQAHFALDKGRDDLAEAAIGRQIELNEGAAVLSEAQNAAKKDERRLAESITELKLRKSQMEEELLAFRSARATAHRETGGRVEAGAERRAAKAEETFNRAMTVARGFDDHRPAVAEAAKVVEIGTLQRQDAVAQRLAALRETKENGQSVAKRQPARRAKKP